MKFQRILVAGALLFLGVSANAVPLTVNDITASWINIDPGSLVATGNGTDSTTMTWGNDIGFGQSGYNFTASLAPFVVDVPSGSESDLFSLGDFTHFNNPITGTSLSSATLQLVVDIAELGNLTFEFDFIHNETPNGDDPCANGEPNDAGVNINGCADIVTVFNSVLSDTFTIGDDLYTFSVEGFSLLPDGPLVDEFQTVEEADNTARIAARIALADPVDTPEPTTLALLSLGLFGMGMRRRMKT